MNLLTKMIIVIALALQGVNVIAQCPLSGYAYCNGAYIDEYYVAINVAYADIGDRITIAGETKIVVEESNALAFGPFMHSGSGLAHQIVQLNGAVCFELLETLCGYRTSNGLHASGSGCSNIDGQSIGYILAQSQPGTFVNDDETRQLYVLSDDQDEFIDFNNTGLFEGLMNSRYHLRAVNVRTNDAADFIAGLDSTEDLENYLKLSCTSVCGDVDYTTTCSSSTIALYIDPDFQDPGDCLNPLNYFDATGRLKYVHDVLEISLAAPDDIWVVRNPQNTFYYQSSPGVFDAVVDGMEIPYVGDGKFQLEIFHEPQIGWTTSIEAVGGRNVGFFIADQKNVCDCLEVGIPTMSSWALFILALLLSIGCVLKLKELESMQPYS